MRNRNSFLDLEGAAFIVACAGLVCVPLVSGTGCSSDIESPRVARAIEHAGAAAAAASGAPASAVTGLSAVGPATNVQSITAAGAVASVAAGNGSSGACDPSAYNQEGCACPKVGASRWCYSGAAATRNTGECHDGTQVCVAGAGEFGQHYGPCMDEVVPSTCGLALDGRCTGHIGCDDPMCKQELGCAMDAGTPAPTPPPTTAPPMDAGMGRCIVVQGFPGATGYFADGGMWCEGRGFVPASGPAGGAGGHP